MAKKKSSLYDLTAAPDASSQPVAPEPEPEAGNQKSDGPIPTVVEVPAACPRCGARERKVTTTYALPDRPMKLPTGELHVGMRLQYARCTKCQQRYNVKLPLPKGMKKGGK